MERNESSGQIAEKNLYTKLSSLENEEVSEIERLRKKLNVIEVKIDDIYNHLLSNKTVDPKRSLVSQLNIVAAVLLTVSLIVLLVGYIGADDLMTVISALLLIVGLILFYLSIMIQSSHKAKEGALRTKGK
jgi:uncharacterized membrane protein